jgi:tetratricopeptide (TPR) repeat protein
VWEGLDAFADMPMRIDDRRLPACRAQFGQNLRDIIGTARRARAPVFLCTMASNLRDWPPLSSLHRAGLPEDELARWNAAYANGEAALKEDRLQAAASAFLACASIDDTHAALAFRLGQTYERMNDAARARHQYIRARDLDAYRFRTDSELNAIIRRIGEAGAEHVRLVDVEAVVESRSPSGFVGESMFVDHVHFTMDGMLVAAGAVADEMAAVLPALRGRPVRPVDAGACRERLLYSAWAEKEILERLESFLDQRVFRGRPDHGLHAERTAARVDDARRDFDRMDMDALRSVYLRNAEIQPDDWSLRFLYGLALKDRDRNEDAAAAFEAALRDHPRHVPAWNNLARTRISLHQPEDAIRCCEQVLLIDPHDADAMVAWGLALVEMGRYPEAVDRFNEALRRRPDLLDVNGYLAMALFAPGRPEESIARFREELRRNPKSAENHDNFGSILAQIGQLDEAQRHFEEAIRLNPSMASPQFHLGLLHARRNRLKEAETNYRNTIALAPDMLDARINLGNVLARQQKFEAAVAEYQAALQAAPSNPDLLFNVGLAMKALRRFDEARAFFARAMEAKPGFDEARSQLETLEKQ